MSDIIEHLAVSRVNCELLADVTLKGDEEDIAELKESLDLQTLLQRQLSDWEKKLDDVDVEVVPQNGLKGFDHDQ
jgi:hypothetical protein